MPARWVIPSVYMVLPYGCTSAVLNTTGPASCALCSHVYIYLGVCAHVNIWDTFLKVQIYDINIGIFLVGVQVCECLVKYWTLVSFKILQPVIFAIKSNRLLSNCNLQCLCVFACHFFTTCYGDWQSNINLLNIIRLKKLNKSNLL